MGNMKKNILLLLSHLDTFGGTHRVAIGLANQMAEDYDVHIVAVHGQSEKSPYVIDERIFRAALLTHEDRLRSLVMKARKPLVRYINEHDIDIVFAIGNHQAFVALSSVVTCRKPKYVFCDHGALANQWDDRTTRTMHRLNAAFYDAVVVLTQQNRQDYIDRLNVNPRKMHVIANGIDSRLVKDPMVFDSAAQTLLWAGRLDQEKGVDHLLAIAVQVLPSRPLWQWHVFGEGELKDWLVQKADEHGLTEQLKILGYTPSLYAEYAQCGVVTLTSYREGLPLVLLEAQACGIPLISFDVTTGPREIINNGVNGFLITPYDQEQYAECLGEMMDDEQLRRKMSSHARDDIDRFSQETVYAQWRMLIEKLVGN
jgi:glycosyltransferase involved in cell wall biosynthesis